MYPVENNKRTTELRLVASVPTLIVTITFDNVWQTQIVRTLEIVGRSAR